VYPEPVFQHVPFLYHTCLNKWCSIRSRKRAAYQHIVLLHALVHTCQQPCRLQLPGCIHCRAWHVIVATWKSLQLVMNTFM